KACSLPRRSRVTRASWPGFGLALHAGDDSRLRPAAWRLWGSAREFWIVPRFSAGGFFVHTPFGPRKSGIPESVEMPAPVSTTTRCASRTALFARPIGEAGPGIGSWPTTTQQFGLDI